MKILAAGVMTCYMVFMLAFPGEASVLSSDSVPCRGLAWRDGITLRTPGGRAVELPRLGGQMNLIVYFTPRTCLACMNEREQWAKLYERHKAEDLSIIGVLGEPGSEKETEKFLKYLKIPFPVVLDGDGAFRERFEIESHRTPFKLLMTAEGKIVHVGWANKTQTSQEKFTDAVEDMLFFFLPPVMSGNEGNADKLPACGHVSCGGRKGKSCARKKG
jgi:peroxiredoxin